MVKKGVVCTFRQFAELLSALKSRKEGEGLPPEYKKVFGTMEFPVGFVVLGVNSPFKARVMEALNGFIGATGLQMNDNALIGWAKVKPLEGDCQTGDCPWISPGDVLLDLGKRACNEAGTRRQRVDVLREHVVALVLVCVESLLRGKDARSQQKRLFAQEKGTTNDSPYGISADCYITVQEEVVDSKRSKKDKKRPTQPKRGKRKK